MEPTANVNQQSTDDAEQRELLERIASGDKAALEALFGHFGDRVFRYAYRLINDSEKANEVTNDVLLAVWMNAAKFDGRSKASTWILGITRNLALNSVRRQALPTVDIDDVAEPIDEAAFADSGARAADDVALKRELQRALNQLSSAHRDVLELTFFHECSYAEIAQIVDCNENTVKTRAFHAKRQLKKILAQSGIDWGTSFATFSTQEGWS